MTTTLTIGAFTIGVTQLLKDLGLQGGKWLRLACVLAGAFAWAMIHYEPAIWEQLSVFLIGLTATGLVSFGDERLQKLRRSR